MYIVDGAVGKLLSAVVTPVYVCSGEILPCIRIVQMELLEIVILEQYDIRKGAVIARGCCQCNCVLNIGRSGLSDDVQLEVRIDVLLIISLSCFQSRNIEVSVPCIDRQRVLVLRSDISCGSLFCVYSSRDHRYCHNRGSKKCN